MKTSNNESSNTDNNIIKPAVIKPAAINQLIVLTALLFSLSLNATASEAISEAIKVKTAPYKDIAINVTHSLGGAVPAENNSISAQISAIIEQFHADTGHEVKKGGLLVTLNCKENRLKLKQASANLKAEKAQLTNAKSQYIQANITK